MGFEVFAGKTSGPCAGVRRALQLAEQAAARPGKTAMLGPIVHNEDILDKLHRAGVGIVDCLDEASDCEAVIVRAHGVPPDVVAQAHKRGIAVIDGTCSFVRSIQKLCTELSGDGYRVCIVGDQDHPEVKAIMGCGGRETVVLADAQQARQVPDDRPLAVISQTTLSPEVMQRVVDVLAETHQRIRVERTICPAAMSRQQEAGQIARAVDVMIVIGSDSSANTRQLAEICREAGTITYMVRCARELDPEWFVGISKVGYIAGASTPGWTIKEVVSTMEDINKRGDFPAEEENAVKNKEQAAAAEETEQTAEETEQTAEETEQTAEETEQTAEETEQAAAAEETEQTAEETEQTAEETEQAAEETEQAAAAEETEQAAAAEETEQAAAAEETECECCEQECTDSEPPIDEATAATEAAEETETEPAAEAADNDMASGVEATMPEMRPGDIVRGKVVAVGQDNVLVDVGYKSEGVIPQWELSDKPFDSLDDVVAVDDEIDVFVLAVEGEEGVLRLSKKKADEEQDWRALEDAFDGGDILEAQVTEEVKGGLIVDVGVRGFMPASHVERGYVSDLSQYVGNTVRVRVIELDKQKNRVILSQKVVLEEEYLELREQTWATIEEGEKRRGVVKSITDFGAFVDVGGVDGLLHVSEMSWGRVNHPSEVVSEGDEIEVAILRIDREKEKISLGLKQALPDPWEDVESKYRVDTSVTGKVVRIVGFGAFVQLEAGVEGLVHISQLANRRVASPDEVVSVGEEIKAKVLRVSSKERRISLSMKEVEQDREQATMKEYMQDTRRDNVTLGDVFGDILNESKDRIGDGEEDESDEG